MKRAIFIIVFLNSVFFGYAQKNEIPNHNSIFEVAKVPLANQLLKEHDAKDVIENHINSSIEGYPKSIKNKKLVATKMHSVIEALHYSYAEHRPISISPDMIWLLICQGVTQHINLNSKELQNEIVTFEKTKEIRVQANSFVKGNPNNAWDELIPSFSDSIKQYVDKELFDSYNISFSSTGSIEKISFQIAMLNTVDNYFDFWTDTECGIPSIKLVGTTNDWTLIEKKIDVFKPYGLENWIAEIKPILQQFIRASEGNIEKEFWEEIYKLKEDCSNIYVTGWIMKFFPYTRNSGNVLIPNSNLFKENLYCDVAFDRIPNGISKVNFKWNYNQSNHTSPIIYNMELCAGFVGISQNKESKMLTPEIIWFVKEQNSDLDIKVINPNEANKQQNYISGSLTAIESLRLGRDCFAPPDEVFTIVEELPIFDPANCLTEIESREAFNKYVVTEIQKLKPKTKIEGEIYVSFVVSSSGIVKQVKILRSDLPELNNLAVQIVEDMPKWKPGMQRGIPVQVRLALPVSFSE